MARLRYNGLATASAPLSLAADLTSGATSVTFNAALKHSGSTAVPTIGAGDFIPLAIINSATGTVSELVNLTAYTAGATTGTISRGQEGTAAVAHTSGDKIVSGPTAAEIAALVSQGDRLRQGSRSIDPYDGVWIQTYNPNTSGMVIWTQKVGDDSTDVNVDGSVIVKHAKGYAATPGYADTVQLYTLAGSKGTIVGNNDYVGSGGTPYAPPSNATPEGFIRFELGPLWPLSERGRWNNQGDFIVGWSTRTVGSSYSQSGTTVTRASGSQTFTPGDVGAYLTWTGGRAGGWCDRITAYVDATHVTVETSRTIASEPAEVWIPKVLLRYDGTVETGAGLVVKQSHGQTGALLDVQTAAGASLFKVQADGTISGAGLPSGGSSGEVLMQDGVTGPPVPIETEDRADWLYQG